MRAGPSVASVSSFVVHFGTFIVDRDEDGRVDLAGPDVILDHRLLKITVIESGGPKAYAFLTTPCFARSSHEIKLPVHTESYDSFGQVPGFVEDLAEVADRRRDAQRVRVTGDDAEFAAFADVAFGSDRTPKPPPATSPTTKAFAASSDVFGLADRAND